MARPLIGITNHAILDPIHKELDEAVDFIAKGVERAGGLPVLIPHGLSDAALRELATRLDGVVLPGGGDVDGEAYGVSHPKINGVDPERDRAERALARIAVDGDLPVFGICRGSQMLNVALGGTLHPALEDMPGRLRHDNYPDIPWDFLAHPVRVEEESRLARILGAPIVQVNSLHHQAVDAVAPALRAVAFAPDGTIEAVEHPTHRFALGVQWHPEGMPNEASARALFEAFVRACAGRGATSPAR